MRVESPAFQNQGSREPNYEQVAQVLAGVLSGMKVGDFLPTESELQQEFGVPRGLVRDFVLPRLEGWGFFWEKLNGKRSRLSRKGPLPLGEVFPALESIMEIVDSSWEQSLDYPGRIVWHEHRLFYRHDGQPVRLEDNCRFENIKNQEIRFQEVEFQLTGAEAEIAAQLRLSGGQQIMRIKFRNYNRFRQLAAYGQYFDRIDLGITYQLLAQEFRYSNDIPFVQSEVQRESGETVGEPAFQIDKSDPVKEKQKPSKNRRNNPASSYQPKAVSAKVAPEDKDEMAQCVVGDKKDDDLGCGNCSGKSHQEIVRCCYKNPDLRLAEKCYQKNLESFTQGCIGIKNE